MKKAVSLILCVIMCAFVFVLSTPVAFAASYNGTCGSSVSWSLNTSDGVLTVSGSGRMNNYSLTATPEWDRYQGYIKSVVFDNGVSYIGAYSFYNGGKGYKYKKLTSVDFGSVETVGEYAFRGCASLSTVINGESVAEVEANAFRSCSALTEFGFCRVTSIGAGAFYGCGFTEISIPETVVSVDTSAFENCDSIETVTIPNTVSTIGDRAFADCGAITLINLNSKFYITCGKGIFSGSGADSGVTLNINNSVRKIPDELFSNCSNLTAIQNGSGLEIIGKNAFAHTGLSYFEVTALIDDINVTAFADCPKLEYFTADSGNQYYSVSDGVLFNKQGNQLVRYPCGKTNTSYTFPSGVNSIKEGAFRESKYLETVNTGSSTLTQISSYCFANSPALTTVRFGNRVTGIGTYAFINCGALSNITLSNVTSIGNYSFSDCDSLSAVPSSSKLKSIGIYAFNSCDGITNVSFGTSVNSIGKYAFTNCRGIRQVTTPSALSTITEGMFSFCPSLSTLNISSSVKTIEKDAFLGCTNLKAPVVPSTVTTIGTHAFGYTYNSSGYSYVKDFVLHCYSGSAASTYASNNSLVSQFITNSEEEIEINIGEDTEITEPEAPAITFDAIISAILSFDYIGFFKQIIGFILSVL